MKPSPRYFYAREEIPTHRGDSFVWRACKVLGLVLLGMYLGGAFR